MFGMDVFVAGTGILLIWAGGWSAVKVIGNISKGRSK